MHKLLTAIFVITFLQGFSQAPSTPVEYMEFLSKREQELSKKYLSYMSEVAHGSRARKMEKRRQEVITAIRQSLNDATKLKPFNGDASLRDAFRNYWDILLKVFNEDYHKIVDMEEIAEQSYDNMEAYLLAQEKAGEVLDQASGNIAPVYSKFAENNNVRLVDGGDSKMQQKLRQVGLVNSYNHQMFLIFFKSYKQEAYVWEAFNKRDVNGVEQNNNALIRVAEEGIAKLDTMKAFHGDQSVRNSCKKVLDFYRDEAKKQIPLLSDFIIKNDDFAKIKKAYDGKSASSRTQSDADVYNKAVNDINDAIDQSNKIATDANNNRKKVLDNWENSRRQFMDRHVPKGN